MSACNASYRSEVPFSGYISLDGLGAVINMADIDRSGSEFILAPEIDSIVVIEQLSLVMRGTANSDFDDYGAVQGGLVNGIDIGIRGPSGILPLMPTIETNQSLIAQWDTFGGVGTGSGGNTDWMQHATIHFDRPLLLDGQRAQELLVTINDDLSDNTYHVIYARGRRVNLLY